MSSIELINIIKKSAKEYSISLEKYQLRIPPNYPTEANIISNIISIFKIFRPNDGIVFPRGTF